MHVNFKYCKCLAKKKEIYGLLGQVTQFGEATSDILFTVVTSDPRESIIHTMLILACHTDRD